MAGKLTSPIPNLHFADFYYMQNEADDRTYRKHVLVRAIESKSTMALDKAFISQLTVISYSITK